jgi:hypothetical protein
LLLIFFITTITGAVYAATSGVLAITSGVTFGTNTELRFVAGMVTNAVSSSGSGYGSYTVDSTGQIMTCSVLLAAPGDSVTLYYDVRNTGVTNAQIVSMVMYPSYDCPAALNIYGSHNDTSGGYLVDSVNPVVFAPGAVRDNCQITFEWVSGMDDSASGIFSVEIRMGYEFTTSSPDIIP